MGKKAHAAKAEMDRKAQDLKKVDQVAPAQVVEVVTRPPKDKFHRPVPERRLQTTSPR